MTTENKWREACIAFYKDTYASMEGYGGYGCDPPSWEWAMKRFKDYLSKHGLSLDDSNSVATPRSGSKCEHSFALTNVSTTKLYCEHCGEPKP